MAADLPAMHDELAVRGIVDDARFTVRVAQDAESHPGTRMVMVALTPLLALSAYESRVWLGRFRPSLNLPEADADNTAWMRHSTKWFDGTRTTIDEALSSFDELVAEHSGQFYGQARWKWARPFETDLGIYRYDQTPFLTTHGVAYAISRNPRLPRTDLATIGRSIAETIGRQAAAIAGTSLASTASFLGELDLRRLNSRDVRSEKFYDRSIGSRRSVSGYLHSVWAQLGFAEMLALTPTGDDRTTALKYRIIILDHAFAAIRRLNDDRDSLGEQLHAAQPAILKGDGLRQLRNVLVHYTPHHGMPASAFDLQRPMRGLLEHHLNLDFAATSDLVDKTIQDLRSRMGVALGH